MKTQLWEFWHPIAKYYRLHTPGKSKNPLLTSHWKKRLPTSMWRTIPFHKRKSLPHIFCTASLDSLIALHFECHQWWSAIIPACLRRDSAYEIMFRIEKRVGFVLLSHEILQIPNVQKIHPHPFLVDAFWFRIRKGGFFKPATYCQSASNPMQKIHIWLISTGKRKNWARTHHTKNFQSRAHLGLNNTVLSFVVLIISASIALLLEVKST